MTVKKSLRGLLFLMMMLLLPTTAAAEELKFPAVPVRIEELDRIGLQYKLQYELASGSPGRQKYFDDFSSITYYSSAGKYKFLKGRKMVGPTDQFKAILIKSNQIEIHTGDALLLNFIGYPKLKLTIKEAQEEQGKQYWNFDWEILDASNQPIPDPLKFAQDKAKAQIQSLNKLRKKDQEAFLFAIDEKSKKSEYMEVFDLLEKAQKWNDASPDLNELLDLLDEMSNLLTDDEIEDFGKMIELGKLPDKTEEIKSTILTAAQLTIPELECTITAPQTDVTLPTEVTITPEQIESCELTWTPDEETNQRIAQEDTAYTAQCRIKLADGKRLIPGKSKITVNGTDVTAELTGTDGEYLVTYTFAETEALKRTYTVTWDPNNGTDSQKQSFEQNEELTLPACTITPPEGKVFDAWLVDGTPYSVGDIVKLTEGTTTIKAQWKDQPTVPDTDAPTDSDTEAPRVPEYRAPQAQTVRMHASDGSGTFVEGPAEALANVHELVVERRSPSRRDLSLRDLSGREVYSDHLMLVTVPVESFGTENLRLLVDGVYTSFSVSEDGKSVTFPAYFTKDGKRPVEDLLFASDDIEVHGNRSVLPEEGCRFVIEQKSAAKFEVNLVNARGETVHTTGPVWISFPALDGNATHWRVKIDGRETTFEVENGRVRVAEMI